MNPSNKKTVLLVMAIAVLTLLAGCGYSFRADGRPVGMKIESIAIPLMTSTSSVKGFEADFTRVMREEFMGHAKVPVVKIEQAQMVLNGSIYEISTQPLTYDTSRQNIGGRVITHETTSSRRLKIRLDVSLTDRSSGKVIWRDASMEEDARFDVGTDPLSNRYNQQEALMKIARLLAKRVYLKTMERF